MVSLTVVSVLVATTEVLGRETRCFFALGVSSFSASSFASIVASAAAATSDGLATLGLRPRFFGAGVAGLPGVLTSVFTRVSTH